MILYLSIGVVIVVSLFIVYNRQSPRTNEAAILLIVYAVTLVSFYLSDIDKRKTEIEKESKFSSYVAYSKKDRHIKEIPLMRYYAATAGTIVVDESLPAFLLRISDNPEHSLDSNAPFKHKKYSHFLRDFMELKVINVMVTSSYHYQNPEPHATAFRFASNVTIEQDLKKIIKSNNRITLDELSVTLKENQLFNSFLQNEHINSLVTANWKDGIGIPEGAEISMKLDHPSDTESRITMTVYNRRFPFFKDSLSIHLGVNDEGDGPLGEWLTAYNNPENFGNYMDYIATESDLTIQTRFASFTLWNPSHIVYQKWLNYLFDSLKFKLDFAEDYKHVDRRMIQSIFESTSVIKHKLDEIEKTHK